MVDHKDLLKFYQPATQYIPDCGSHENVFSHDDITAHGCNIVLRPGDFFAILFSYNPDARML